MEESKKEELQNILNQIENLYYVDNIEDRKDELLNLWTRYYQLAYSYHIQLDSAYNLFLLGENVCYVIDSKLNRQKNIEVPEASFDYPLHHAFGTVKIPILENGILKEECIHVEHDFGFFGRNDGKSQSFDLCEDCYEKLLEHFAVPVQTWDRTELL